MDAKPLIIIGTGPAGYTASLYASRYKIKHTVIGALPGGQIGEAHKVCNFPGFAEISGVELAGKLRQQAKNLGAEEVMDTVVRLTKKGDLFKIATQFSGDFLAKTVILATGTKRRKLGLPREKDFLGKGVSYCATCDGSFYQNKTVAVIGGANSAVTATLMLADIAQQVYLIYRKNALRADPAWVEQLKKRKNVVVIYNTNVVGLLGEERLTALELDSPYQEQKTISVDGMFVEIGSIPDLGFAKDLALATDEKGYLRVNQHQETNIRNLFSAGDITTNSDNFRQAITACGEGAVSARSVYQRLAQ